MAFTLHYDQIIEQHDDLVTLVHMCMCINLLLQYVAMCLFIKNETGDFQVSMNDACIGKDVMAFCIIGDCHIN